MSLPSRSPASAERARVAAASLAGKLQSALQQNDRGQIVDTARGLVEAHAPLGAQWRVLAQILGEKGELSLMRKALDLFVEAAGGTDDAKFQQAAQLAEAECWSEAYELLCTLAKTVPDEASNGYSRGISLLNLGRPDEARDYLERTVQTRPYLGSPWLALAISVDLSTEPELAERIVAAERGMINATSDQRAPYYYALGKAYAERGEHSAAFAAFSQGAREMRSLVAYRRNLDSTLAADAVQGYNAESIAALASQQCETTDRTIFVNGLPRSGTTLVQQILTAHSNVRGGAETNRLSLLGADVGGVSHPQLVRYVEKVGAPAVARRWDHWLSELFPDPGRVVDKTTNTSRMLGLAASLLPDAPLIWVTRDPLDRAWSCYRINFAHGAMPWSYDLADIAFHFRLEDSLLAQWQQILGDRLLVVSYEALASDPAATIRQILRHCGLAEEPQVFAPHENSAPVTTCSLMQIRRPINRDAIGAAEPYREFLEPFLAAYHG